jgi:hypothetical protein
VHALNRLTARIAAGPRVTPERMTLAGVATSPVTPSGVE